MPNIKLSMACADYDRTRAIREGFVSPKGIDLTYIPLRVEEIFWRQLQYNEFHISEMSLSNYTSEKSGGNPRFVAIPIFTSRFFRHGYIFINKKSGIKYPQDLKGKKVGMPEYSMTANLFIRGLLKQDYGLDVTDIEWYEGGKEGYRKKNRVKGLILPAHIQAHMHDAPPDKSLSDMLVDGDIDALIGAEVPECIWKKNPRVARLFPDYRKSEIDWYRRTKIFPIMHTVVIRNDVYDANPWVAESIYEAFVEAKKWAQDFIKGHTGAMPYMLPWMFEEYNTAVSEMGEDYWPYGLENNRVVLEAATRYSFEQGLSSRKLSPDELFAPNCKRD